MYLSVDLSKCEAHGLCALNYPRLFTLDDAGYSNIGDHRELSPADEPSARAGVQFCPVGALTID